MFKNIPHQIHVEHEWVKKKKKKLNKVIEIPVILKCTYVMNKIGSM